MKIKSSLSQFWLITVHVIHQWNTRQSNRTPNPCKLKLIIPYQPQVTFEDSIYAKGPLKASINSHFFMCWSKSLKNQNVVFVKATKTWYTSGSPIQLNNPNKNILRTATNRSVNLERMIVHISTYLWGCFFVCCCSYFVRKDKKSR